MLRPGTGAGARAPYLVDTRVGDASVVADFGLQWRSFDPYPELEALSFGHLYGRFLLPQGYFRGKTVVDLGCGNGRLGRFVIPDAAAYVGVDLSDALLAFELPAGAEARVELLRASLERLPLIDGSADVVLCWGVLHHVGDVRAAMREIERVLKPGGTLLLYVYPDSYASRENLNRLFRVIEPQAFHAFCVWFFRTIRRWSELDPPLARELCQALCVSPRMHTGWEIIQMFDGLGPEHHHLLEQAVVAHYVAPWSLRATHAGCYVIGKPGTAASA